MRVSWFAPLPPAPGAAARCTLRLLPALAARADLTLWTTQQEWDRGLEATAPVRRFDPEAPPWAEWNAADICVYYLGDGPDADVIAALARVHPGVVVLHNDAAPDVAPTLGVVVQDREAFARRKRENRCPVLYLPLPDMVAESCAGKLLEFAAEARSFAGGLVAQDLARQVAAEVSLWGGAIAGPAWLQQVAQEIHQLTTAGAAAPPLKARAA